MINLSGQYYVYSIARSDHTLSWFPSKKHGVQNTAHVWDSVQLLVFTGQTLIHRITVPPLFVDISFYYPECIHEPNVLEISATAARP